MVSVRFRPATEPCASHSIEMAYSIALGTILLAAAGSGLLAWDVATDSLALPGRLLLARLGLYSLLAATCILVVGIAWSFSAPRKRRSGAGSSTHVMHPPA